MEGSKDAAVGGAVRGVPVNSLEAQRERGEMTYKDETIKEMQERHRREYNELRNRCPHNKVRIEDTSGHNGFGRRITMKCDLCGEPIVGWEGRENHGEGSVLYAKGFITRT